MNLFHILLSKPLDIFNNSFLIGIFQPLNNFLFEILKLMDLDIIASIFFGIIAVEGRAE